MISLLIVGSQQQKNTINTALIENVLSPAQDDVMTNWQFNRWCRKHHVVSFILLNARVGDLYNMQHCFLSVSVQSYWVIGNSCLLRTLEQDIIYTQTGEYLWTLSYGHLVLVRMHWKQKTTLQFSRGIQKRERKTKSAWKVIIVRPYNKNKLF